MQVGWTGVDRLFSAADSRTRQVRALSSTSTLCFSRNTTRSRSACACREFGTLEDWLERG